MKDLQILVDKCVVKEAEDALAAVHDIPENDDRFDVVRSVSTGAVPSAEDMDRVFTKWHEQVQLSVAAGVEMTEQRGMPLQQTVATPLRCCLHVSPNLVLCTGSTRRSSSRRESLGA